MHECYFVWLGKLLKCGMTTIGKFSALAGAGFADYGVVLEKCNTYSKVR